MHIAICDDEPNASAHVRHLVDDWARAHGHVAHIAVFDSAEAFLFALDAEPDWDILLLDIEMGGMTGVELAKSVRAHNKEVQIVFITGYMEYIADGYDVEALHYLIKPLAADRFFAVLDRAMDKLGKNERALLLDLGDQSVRVPLHDILYLDVQRNYVTVHAREAHTVKTSLSELGRELDERFFRAGRSHIINLHHVRRITRTDVFLSDGSSIPLPRGMYDAINRAVIDRM